ncbi:MAG: DUF711 family protein [Deltaproteobacteria bacterium]
MTLENANPGRRALLGAAILSLVSLCLFPRTTSAEAMERPKIRAITAFVHLDRARYEEEISEALKMLRKAKADYEMAGYQVESIRITTQPFTDYTRGLSREGALAFLRKYDALAQRESFATNIGPAIMSESNDPAAAELLSDALSQTTTLEGSVIVAGGSGIRWDSVVAAARIIRHLTDHSPNSQGTFNFAATAMLEPYAPFYPGSYHAGEGHRFTIGWEAANVVAEAFATAPGNAPRAAEQLANALTPHAVAVERIARSIEKETGWTYMGLDATPVPLGDVSIGGAIEKYTGAKFGSSGTMTAASIITNAVKALPVKHVGYSGLMLPVMEDKLLAQRWSEGTYTIDSLLAYSAVCGTGLDTIPLPGDVSEEQLVRIIGDVASLAYKWHKPLTARLQPVKGRKAGERTAFNDPFLFNTLIRPLP